MKSIDTEKMMELWLKRCLRMDELHACQAVGLFRRETYGKRELGLSLVYNGDRMIFVVAGWEGGAGTFLI